MSSIVAPRHAIPCRKLDTRSRVSGYAMAPRRPREDCFYQVECLPPESRQDEVGTMPVVGERAIVLGASIGGLLAARVLSESYRTVTVVERDVLPADAAPR